MAIDFVEPAQTELHVVAGERGAVRAGATTDLHGRIRRYVANGYAGTLYAATTLNMRHAEDNLLTQHEFRHDRQGLSNVPAAPG